jgi:tripartite-type tricarboxylate transporter receptor subunit TctC
MNSPRQRALRAVSALVIGAAVVAGAGVCHAQSYPERPIRIITPFAAGTASDVIPRIVLEKAGPLLGPRTSFVFENMPGAGGNTGTATIAKQPGDGYRIGATAVGPLAINATLFRKLPYNPEVDFVPITPSAFLSNTVVVSNKSGLKSLKELIDFAKANPGKLTYSSVGPGSSQHLSGVLFEQMTGSNMVHLPYRVTGQLVTDLVNGQVPLSFQNITNVKEQAVAGNLRILAIAADTRHASIPDVPTTAEAGLPGFISSAWFCFVAPKGTPKPIVDKLNAAIVAALKDPAIKAKLNALGAEPLPMSPEEFKKFIASETVRWRGIIEKSGMAKL